MRARGSHTAQWVALARAVLTDKGLVDDPYAAWMLRPTMRMARMVLGAVPRATKAPVYPALGARTLWFDDQVAGALDQGVAQVVTVGAGYDSRPWRCARPGVRFWDVDHPATQARKRRRAPPGRGPVYVPLDLTTATIDEALSRNGLDAEDRTVFVIEGVTMYLDVEDVRALLRQVGSIAAPGSRLAINFASGQMPGRRPLDLVASLYGEPKRSGGAIGDPTSFVASSGWVPLETTTIRHVAEQRLRLDPAQLNKFHIAPELVLATRQ